MTVIDRNHLTIEVLDEREATARYDQLKAEAQMPLAELKMRGERFELDEQQRALLAELEDLEWLLGR